jgi:hypothetical protein
MLRARLDLMPETAPTLRSHLSVSGHDFQPLVAGALYWEAEDTLLVADLHMEKGAAFAALGMLLPPYDTRSQLPPQRMRRPYGRRRSGASHQASKGSRVVLDLR